MARNNKRNRTSVSSRGNTQPNSRATTRSSSLERDDLPPSRAAAKAASRATAPSAKPNKRKKAKRPENEYFDLSINEEEECTVCGLTGHVGRDCPQPKPACFNCAQEGHRTAECPQPKSIAKRQPQACFICGQEGHFKSSCPEGRTTTLAEPTSPPPPPPAEPAPPPPPPMNKFTPFRSLACNIDLGDSDDEDEAKADEPAAPTLDAPATESGEGEPASKEPPPLLLPEHVTMGEDGAEDGEAAVPGDAEEEEVDMTGIAVVDDNRAAGLIRYYDPKAIDPFFASADLGRVCRNCKKPGHAERDCTTLICLRCGEEGHQRNDCPHAKTCRYCGQTGHAWQMCQQRAVQKEQTGSTRCPLCGSHAHGATGCELAWRTYVYYPRDVREEVVKRRAEAKSWEAEAIGGDPMEVFCYNCAGVGHLGDNCPRPKGSKAPITQYPSAFSEDMARRGPYGAPSSSGRHPNATHTKWVDDHKEVDPGFAGFGGANPGRRAREANQARQRDMDRQRDDRDDWFSRRDGGSSRDNWRDRGGGPRGGGNYDRERSPDRRGPAGSLASRITGMATSAPARYANSAPQHGQGRGPIVSDSYRPAPRGGDRDRGGRYGDRRDNRHGEAELEEREWRASGAGGGRVTGWGEEMDREERRMRDDRPRAGPVRGGYGGGGSGFGNSGSGRGGRGGRGGAARGQRYTGGY